MSQRVPTSEETDERIRRLQASGALESGPPPEAFTTTPLPDEENESTEERSATTNGQRVSSSSSFSSSPAKASEPWPELEEAALHGLAGRVVRTLAPETEADPAGLLVSFLVAFGNMAWSPYAVAGAASHPARLNAVLVGDSSRARKGTSWAETSRLLCQAHTSWWAECMVSGLSSGEGLINEVRDDAKDPISGSLGGGVQVRLIHEAEFAHVLKIAGREGNILSTVLRDVWDGRDLRILTRKDPMKATAAHISILAHITAEELRRYLTETDMASGFANRFLFCMVRRSKLLPNGGNLDPAVFDDLSSQVGAAVQKTNEIRRVHRTAKADAVWADANKRWAEEAPGGLAGAIVARPEAQTLRLSVAYAALDGSNVIDVPHVKAALAPATSHLRSPTPAHCCASSIVAALSSTQHGDRDHQCCSGRARRIQSRHRDLGSRDLAT